MRLPIFLGPGANDEYEAQPLSPAVVEAKRLARHACDENARRTGMSRRDFLRSACGAATTLLVLQACSDDSKGGPTGGRFRIPDEATTEPGAAQAVLGGDEFVFDVQNHFLEYDLQSSTAGGFFGSGFPQAACGEADPRACFSMQRYLDEVFVRSDTSMAVLSALPIPPEGSPLGIDTMERTRRALKLLCHDDRLLLHGQALPTRGELPAALAAMERVAADHPIAAWKVYTHTPGTPWSLDDHDAGVPMVGTAFVDKARELGIPRVCVHKGLAGGNRYASPADIGPAARRHPDVDFVVYHSGYEAGQTEGPYAAATRDRGVNRLIASMADAGVGPDSNVYAELGSTWWNVMRSPDEAAHVLGKLLRFIGEDNVVWGTDSIWYGSPQGQIQAFRAFEIMPEFQERFGYPALTKERKAKILGLNAARLYGVAAEALARCR